MSDTIKNEQDQVLKKHEERTFDYISYGLAFLAACIGFLSVFNTHIICQAHDKALLWFAFSLLAILVPYLKILLPRIQEITFKDLKIAINQINDASERLEGAAISVKELNNRLNATRDELINGYQELLRLLPEEERKKRVISLSKLYLNEMGVDIKTVKKWLVEIGQPVSTDNEAMNDEYLDSLKKLQKAYGLGDDGIFGYRTLRLINELRSKSKDTSKTGKCDERP
jgi:hypothetical protein